MNRGLPDQGMPAEVHVLKTEFMHKGGGKQKMIDLLPFHGQKRGNFLRLKTVIDGDQGIHSFFLIRERGKHAAHMTITSCQCQRNYSIFSEKMLANSSRIC